MRSAIHEHVADVTDVEIVVEWEPPWNPGMMSVEAMRQLDGGR